MKTTQPFVLFDDARKNAGMRLYADPVRILTCTRPEDVAQTLADIDRAVDAGLHVAGYLAYELGYALEPKLAPLCPQNLDAPLIWMGVFKAPQMLATDEAAALMAAWAKDGYEVGAMQSDMTRDRYLTNVETVRDHIRAGDVYQINYTFKQSFDYSGSPLGLYAHLRSRQRARFGAVIHTGDRHILSLSPELFIEVHGDTARTRPMKGTAARAASPQGDAERRHWLCHDEKSQAENLMIVDLLRNDLGRIAALGTVAVTDLFSVETYPTLHQMTSGIEANLRSGTAFSDVLGALYPCGSVTGAPKVKAMEIIQGLEDGPRGVYTGAIGFASAEATRFNVAIRTLTLDPGGYGEMGIGSGIVYDSDPVQEWDECHLKARFLTEDAPSFQVLETLKWTPEDGWGLLRHHLDRLRESAAYFCYDYDPNTVTAALNAAVTGQTAPQRVRLTLNAQGRVEVETLPLTQPAHGNVMTYAVSNQTVDTSNPFTYHKTTNRAFYDDARTGVSADEVLFLNAQGQLTEGSITNIFVEKDGQLLTPPIACGLLAGTLRRELLDSGRCVEAVLTRADLKASERVYLGNSVRGLVLAKAE